MTDEHERILKHAISHYGEAHQIDKAIEEMSELTKALLKLRYAAKGYELDILQKAVAEEIADVGIMLRQLRMIFDFDTDILRYEEEKVQRLQRQMKKELGIVAWMPLPDPYNASPTWAERSEE